MATTNGDWTEMKRLVLARMDENKRKLGELDDKVAEINTQLAILADREDRELAMAKTTSMKVAATVGTGMSAIVAAFMRVFGGY